MLAADVTAVTVAAAMQPGQHPHQAQQATVRRPVKPAARMQERRDHEHKTSRSGRPISANRQTPQPPRTGLCAFSRTVSVTQRHAVDRHHLEADLRFSAAWTGLPDAHRSLVEVLVEAVASSACGHIMLELARDMRHESMPGQGHVSVVGALGVKAHHRADRTRSPKAHRPPGNHSRHPCGYRTRPLGPGANKTAKSPDGWSHCEQIPQELSRHFPITPASSNKKSLAAWACRQAAPSKAGRRSGIIRCRCG